MHITKYIEMYSLTFLLLTFGSFATSQFAVERSFKLSLTLSAKKNALEVSWSNLKNPNNGIILLTDEEPRGTFRRHLAPNVDQPLHGMYTTEDNSTAEYYANSEKYTWTYNHNQIPALQWLQPTESSGWVTTNVIFKSSLLDEMNINTTCYGYWAVYVGFTLQPIFSTCIRAYPTWMNDNKSTIKKFKFRDLMILGTHDSGSFRKNFNATENETLVTKYSLTQSDDVTTQLMHGVRYLDIRVGYYRSTDEQFWVNHGITRQQPLLKILRQVREFVLETNEIVIFDIQEFPVGFGKSLDIHRKLVHLIQMEIGELLVDPSHGWEVKLETIWQRKRNIILSYDHNDVVNEFPSFLFQSVQHRWGNCQSLSDLKRFLSPAGHTFVLFSNRPYADMAEITPTAWDVITDKWGGLRKIADQSNRHISKWYADDWFISANIVAVDFYRGTNLMETVIYSNQKKDLLRQSKK